MIAELRREVETEGIRDPDRQCGLVAQPFLQGGRQLPIQLHRQDGGPALEQRLGEDARAGADLHHRAAWADTGRIHDGVPHPPIHQEVLSAGLSRSQATRGQKGPGPGQKRRQGPGVPGHPATAPGAVARLR